MVDKGTLKQVDSRKLYQTLVVKNILQTIVSSLRRRFNDLRASLYLVVISMGRIRICFAFDYHRPLSIDPTSYKNSTCRKTVSST